MLLWNESDAGQLSRPEELSDIYETVKVSLFLICAISVLGAYAVGRSVQRVSTVLGALCLAEVARYETDGKRNLYRLKYPSEVKGVLSALSCFVKAASVVGRQSPLCLDNDESAMFP
jgi:hypothetical protein